MRRAVRADDVVVVPSGRRAIAIEVLEDGRIDLAYLNNGRPDRGDMVALAPDLVRRIEHGLVPTPVRIPWPKTE